MNSSITSFLKTEHVCVLSPGTLDYDTALSLQLNHRELVLQRKTNGAIILLEHDPSVITLGRNFKKENLLAPVKEIEDRGIQIRQTTRGGDVTVHEKGQLVIYFILPVNSKDAFSFIESLMNLIIHAVNKHWGIETTLGTSRPGIWAGDRKLGSFGFDLTSGASMHGVALNISNTLEGFKFINPCGISPTCMTTLERELGRNLDFIEVRDTIHDCLIQI